MTTQELRPAQRLLDSEIESLADSLAEERRAQHAGWTLRDPVELQGTIPHVGSSLVRLFVEHSDAGLTASMVEVDPAEDALLSSLVREKSILEQSLRKKALIDRAGHIR